MIDPPMHGDSQNLGNCGSWIWLPGLGQLAALNMLLPSSISNRVELMTIENDCHAEHLMF